MRNKATQISLGYGFLEFSSHESASTVLATFNGKAMPGTNNVFRYGKCTVPETSYSKTLLSSLKS